MFYVSRVFDDGLIGVSNNGIMMKLPRVEVLKILKNQGYILGAQYIPQTDSFCAVECKPNSSVSERNFNNSCLEIFKGVSTGIPNLASNLIACKVGMVVEVCEQKAPQKKYEPVIRFTKLSEDMWEVSQAINNFYSEFNVPTYNVMGLISNYYVGILNSGFGAKVKLQEQ